MLLKKKKKEKEKKKGRFLLLRKLDQYNISTFYLDLWHKNQSSLNTIKRNMKPSSSLELYSSSYFTLLIDFIVILSK